MIVADGIGALGLCSHYLMREIPHAGLPHRVEIHDWHHGFGRWLLDLIDRRNHRQMTARLVERVQTFQREFPDRPVYLIGKSGGAGQVVWALESLPLGSVELAVLIAPALSPGYDLGTALRGVRRALVVYHSRLDLVLLGLGTSLFGTIDRVWGVSSGLVGFQSPTPPNSAAATEPQLRQVAWTVRELKNCWLGGHFSVDWPPFLRRHVLPLLAPESGSPRTETQVERELTADPSPAESPASAPPRC